MRRCRPTRPAPSSANTPATASDARNVHSSGSRRAEVEILLHRADCNAKLVIDRAINDPKRRPL
jgi:hypothetical protein